MNSPFLNTSSQRASMRVSVVATLLDTDISTIYKMVRAGTLEAHRVGKRGVRVFADSVRKYQEQKKIFVKDVGERKSLQSENKESRVSSAAYREAVDFLQSIGCLSK